MATTYINNTLSIKSLKAEVGAMVESFRMSERPQNIDPLLNEDNERVAAAVNATMNSFTVTGEIKFTSVAAGVGTLASGDIFFPDFDTVTAMVNTNAQLACGGGIYMTDVEITFDRAGWQSATSNYEAYAGQT